MSQLKPSRLILWAVVWLGVAACGPLPGPVAEAAAKEGAKQAAASKAAPASSSAPRAAAPALRRPPTPRVDWTPTLDSIVEEYTRIGLKHAGGKARARDFDVSVHVIDLQSGQEWGARRADEAKIPASNMKLVTTAAALVLLGPGQDFVTPVELLGEVRGGVLEGDLVLRAAGDPIVDPHGAGQVESRLDVIVAALRARGITRIQGDVVLDESSFAEPGPAPGWPASNQYWQEHCALSGGFSINGGVLQALVSPSARGARAQIEVHPAPHGLRSNYGVASSGKRLNVQVGATRTAVTVKGELPAKHAPYLAEFSHPDPVQLFGSVLEARLMRGGIQLHGRLRRERHAPAGESLVALRSSLDDVLVPINTHSRNSVADQLLLALGHALGKGGTLMSGAKVTRRALSELGVPSAGFVQADGSGLSRDNRVTARQLTALIAGVLGRDPETRRVFQASLARNGEPGSLESRLLGEQLAGRVFAKTGWITGASSISGLCLTEAGHELVFSILVSYPAQLGGLNTRCFKPMQDALIQSLVLDTGPEAHD